MVPRAARDPLSDCLGKEAASVDSPAVPKATKRERQRQNKEARRAAVQEAEKRHKRNRTIRNLVLLLIPLVVVFVIVQLTKSDDDGTDTKSASNVACGAKAPSGKPTTTTLAAAPEMTIDPAKQYTAVMSTSCGDVTIALDAATAPQTVNSFVTLARGGFYDNTQFHRIVPDFVDQGGDPTGTGTGGPGYDLPDEPPTDGYEAGSVAMANAGSGTTGSQFFLVVSDSGAQQLGTEAPFKYSSLGTMDAAGLKVAQKINSFGGQDEKPTKRVYVYGVDITESDAAPTTTAPATTAAP
jgi:peptidyl-prolyl cis-trans isomerase B (cyclophilin B)